jgi:1-acyl-sn-glycerol-3-phosphate acyltransferase
MRLEFMAEGMNPGSAWRPSHFRAAWRATALILATMCCALIQTVGLTLRLPVTRTLPRRWHQICCALLSIKVRPFGTAVTDGPVLYVCNHASYLDVSVLGALLDGRFVAKAEVARWPVIGALSTLQGTIFVDRRSQGARSQANDLRRALLTGANLVLFPEGTSSDGNKVLSFKSALFAAADATIDGREVRVQPVTVAYSRYRGLPMERRMRPYFAWYGDMTLVGHLWTCMGLGGAGVDVLFHEPVALSEFSSRKELAETCHARVAWGLSEALAGRVGSVPAPASSEVASAVLDWGSFGLLETRHEM